MIDQRMKQELTYLLTLVISSDFVVIRTSLVLCLLYLSKFEKGQVLGWVQFSFLTTLLLFAATTLQDSLAL